MLYRDYHDKKLSLLGLGAMRLPVIEGDDSRIDIEKTALMVEYSIKNGINYFDTAWGYHGGNSEKVLGSLLKKYPRDSYYIASKFPGYDLENMSKVKEIFEEQLERCGVEYFDFYMLHNVCETNIHEYLDERYGIMEYLFQQKKEGRIKHLGFSAHGNPDTMKRFLDVYGKDMEFCQLQLNYIDIILQDGEKKLEMLAEAGIPVWVMEPLRGGNLVSIPEGDEKKLREVNPDRNLVEWAFKYLMALPNIKMILSGMSDMDQLKENIAIFNEGEPLNGDEMNVLLSVAEGMLKDIMPCTSCRYCTSYCPQELDIPALLKLFNDHNYSGGGWLAPMILESFPEEKQPSACIGCRACEAVCPQKIEISKGMESFANTLK